MHKIFKICNLHKRSFLIISISSCSKKKSSFFQVFVSSPQIRGNTLAACQFRGSPLSVNGELQQQAAALARSRHPSMVEHVVPRVQKPRDPEREKRRIARKKEKRATLILGLIMGSFIACWLPFFFMYILRLAYQIPGIAFSTAFWLG